MKSSIQTSPFILRETVCETGYEWLKDVDGKPRLVPKQAPGVAYRLCQPHPALFRQFAGLAPTREDIAAFAGLYGDIFNSFAPEQSATSASGAVMYGSSFGTWTKEIGDMRALVDLWEHVRARRVGPLKQIIKWTEKEVGYVIRTPRRAADEMLAHADLPGSGFGRFKRRDVVLPAKCALQREINKRLAEMPTVPRLAWTPDFDQRLIFVPANLLGAMWLQFAQAVTGEFDLYACDACGEFFQRGPGGRRADATTCSDRCRQRKKRNGPVRDAVNGRAKRTG